jgi:rhamnose transport system ATP-binding protein
MAAMATGGQTAASAGPSAPPVLALRGVSKRYGTVQALDGVSVELRRGRIVALCGENGAGKSTLSAIAAGLVRPDAGALELDGEPVVFGSAREAHEAGVRIAPQELVVCPNLTVAENVGLGRFPRRGPVLDGAALRRVAIERLQQLGHPIDPDAVAGELTVVEQACVQIARAVAPGVRVLIVDEPTAPMSDAEADRFMTMIRRLADEGLAIVYVSHRLDEAFRLADEIVVLRDGRLVAAWPRDEVDRGMLVRAMVGDRDLTVARRRGARGGHAVLRVEGLASRRLREASFTVHRGEIVGVYGIAGSGREDLGPAVVGAQRPDDGRVHAGETVIRDVRTAIAAGVGFVPAERRTQGLILERSVGENVTLGMLRRLARWLVMRAGEERRTAQDWIDRLAIATPSPSKPVGLLSGGSQQKVVLARWLAAGSRVLVLDEPTRGVDVATKAEIYRLLRGLADDGGAVLVITSDVEEVVAVSDRTLVLRRGRIVRELHHTTEAEVAESALIEDTPVDATTAAASRSGGAS